MAVKVTVNGTLPDGAKFCVEGDTVSEVVDAFKLTYSGLTAKESPSPTPDPPPGS